MEYSFGSLGHVSAVELVAGGQKNILGICDGVLSTARSSIVIIISLPGLRLCAHTIFSHALGLLNHICARICKPCTMLSEPCTFRGQTFKFHNN